MQLWCDASVIDLQCVFGERSLNASLRLCDVWSQIPPSRFFLYGADWLPLENKMYKMLCVSNFTVSMYDALARHKQRVDDPALADIFIASNSYCDSGEKNWPLYGISLTTRRSRSMARAHFPPPHLIANSSAASVLTSTRARAPARVSNNMS